MVPLDNTCTRESKVPEFSQSSNISTDPPLLLDFASPSSVPSTSDPKSWEQKGRHASGCISDSDRQCWTPEIDGLQPSFQELPRDFEAKVPADRNNAEKEKIASIPAQKLLRQKYSRSSFRLNDQMAKQEELSASWNEPSRGFPISASVNEDFNQHLIAGSIRSVPHEQYSRMADNFPDHPTGQARYSNDHSLGSDPRSFLRSQELLERYWFEKRHGLESTENSSRIHRFRRSPSDDRFVESPRSGSFTSDSSKPTHEVYQQNPGYHPHRFSIQRRHERFDRESFHVLDEPNNSSHFPNKFSHSLRSSADQELNDSRFLSERHFSEESLFPSNQQNSSSTLHRKYRHDLPLTTNSIPNQRLPISSRLDNANVSVNKTTPVDDFPFRQPSNPISTNYARRRSSEGMYVLVDAILLYRFRFIEKNVPNYGPKLPNFSEVASASQNSETSAYSKFSVFFFLNKFLLKSR